MAGQHSLPTAPRASSALCDWAQRCNWEGHADEGLAHPGTAKGDPRFLSPLAPSHRGMETADPPPEIFGSLRSLQKSGCFPCASASPDSGCLCIFVYFLLLSKQVNRSREDPVSAIPIGLHVSQKRPGHMPVSSSLRSWCLEAEIFF